MPEYDIIPCPAPRQSRKDAWAKRPIVLKYRAFCDECRLKIKQPPANDSKITFVIPMAASWSKKKKAAFDGQPHQQTPDIDNLLKALFDALLPEDSGIWCVNAKKLWGYEGKIIIE